MSTTTTIDCNPTPASAALLATALRARAHGLNLTQLCVLATVGVHGSISMVAIGRIIRASSVVMTLNADTLTAAGHLTRASDPDDRRLYILTLTEQGRATLEAIAAA